MYTVGMIYTVPIDKPFDIEYDETVYSPEHTSLGSVLIAAQLIKDGKKPNMKILDVGCGSGVLGLSIKRMNPFTEVILCDIDKNAVRVTKRNAEGLDVTVLGCDLFPTIGEFDIVVANLPTFDQEQMKTEELHGPKVAYAGGKRPLRLYSRLLSEARFRTRVLICECQPKYQTEFQVLAAMEGWTLIMNSGDCFAFW